MIQPDDWRLANAPQGSLGATLRQLRYKQPSATWDHEHCAFCWQKIAEAHVRDSVHEGFVFPDERNWVCPQCFADLSKHFEWHNVDEMGC